MSRKRKFISGNEKKKKRKKKENSPPANTHRYTQKHTQVENHEGPKAKALWVQRADFNGPSSLSIFTSLSLQSSSPLSSCKCRSHLFFSLSAVQHLLTGLSSPPSHPLLLSKSVSISFCFSSPLSFPHFKLIFHCTKCNKASPTL